MWVKSVTKIQIRQLIKGSGALMSTVLKNRKGGVHICRVANGDLTWENQSYTSTLEGQGSISCGQYLDRNLGKFPPLYGPHLSVCRKLVRFSQKVLWVILHRAKIPQDKKKQWTIINRKWNTLLTDYTQPATLNNILKGDFQVIYGHTQCILCYSQPHKVIYRPFNVNSQYTSWQTGHLLQHRSQLEAPLAIKRPIGWKPSNW